jgi:hypothetical protein
MADTDAADEKAIFEMEQERDDGIAPLGQNGNKKGSDPLLEAASAAINGDVEGNKDIAHSPSDSMSSLDSAGSKGPGMGQRRMSNVSDEERERARVYREGVMGRGRESSRDCLAQTKLTAIAVDLAGIAKTSYGIAQSPPNNSFGTSPTSRVGHLAVQIRQN